MSTLLIFDIFPNRPVWWRHYDVKNEDIPTKGNPWILTRASGDHGDWYSVGIGLLPKMSRYLTMITGLPTSTSYKICSHNFQRSQFKFQHSNRLREDVVLTIFEFRTSSIHHEPPKRKPPVGHGRMVQVVFITQWRDITWIACCFFCFTSHIVTLIDSIGYNNVRASSFDVLRLSVCLSTNWPSNSNHQRRSELRNAKNDTHADGDNDCDNEWRRDDRKKWKLKVRIV